MTRDWLCVATIRRPSSSPRPALRWRNRIVTLLIERPVMRRVEIHRALRGDWTEPTIEAQIDSDLTEMVRRGDIARPRRGYYSLPCPKSSAKWTTSEP